LSFTNWILLYSSETRVCNKFAALCIAVYINQRTSKRARTSVTRIRVIAAEECTYILPIRVIYPTDISQPFVQLTVLVNSLLKRISIDSLRYKLFFTHIWNDAWWNYTKYICYRNKVLIVKFCLILCLTIIKTKIFAFDHWLEKSNNSVELAHIKLSYI